MLNSNFSVKEMIGIIQFIVEQRNLIQGKFISLNQDIVNEISSTTFKDFVNQIAQLSYAYVNKVN